MSLWCSVIQCILEIYILLWSNSAWACSIPTTLNEGAAQTGLYKVHTVNYILSPWKDKIHLNEPLPSIRRQNNILTAWLFLTAWKKTCLDVNSNFKNYNLLNLQNFEDKVLQFTIDLLAADPTWTKVLHPVIFLYLRSSLSILLSMLTKNIVSAA